MRFLYNCINRNYRLCLGKINISFQSNFINNSRNISVNYKMESSKNPSLFEGLLDRFDGITVDSQKEQCDLNQFPQKLEASLKHWQETSKRGIWFKVFLDQSQWVPILAKNGFKYHHAKEDFVMMYRWISPEPCNIPPYAHTMIGVGAVVVNDKNQVLVVKEKYFVTPHYKLPGGYVEPGENLVDAAIREVEEETSIKTKFHTLLTFRHAHNGMFGCSDIYNVISLKPLTTDIVADEREIAEAMWLDVQEYLNHPNIHELNKFFVNAYLKSVKKNIKLNWHHGIHQILKKPYTVYYMETEEEELAGKP